MELRHLRYFAAVAEEQSFTRAAARLHVSVPPLSRQIRDLERELGVPLFERTTRTVHLTEAGRMFQTEAAAILRRTDEAMEAMRALAHGQRGRVRVGYAASPTIEILPRALRRFHQTRPQARVELHDLSTQAMLRGLREGTLDVALLVSLSPRDFVGLEVEEIATYPVRVAVHAKHRFARLPRVRLREIAGEPLVAFSREGYPEAHQAIAKILAPYTRSPRIVGEYDGAVSLIAAVEAGRGVALVYEVAGLLAGPRLVLRPIEPEPPAGPISIVCRPDGNSAATAAFVAVVKEAGLKAAPLRRRALVVP